MSDTQLPQGIINPFSDIFLPIWAEWKEYRWEQHKFKYKGTRSEQAALMKINDVSEQNEAEAIEIIKESMANGWMGFFKRKTYLNGQQSVAESRKNLANVLGRRNYENRGS
jgi:3-phosphoglycerate kinase